MEIGDQVEVDGIKGTVVALIEDGKFSPDCPESDWAYLKSGVLVLTKEAALIYCPDLHATNIVRIPS